MIVGKHVSENPKPYNKLRTIHGAPIYLTQDEGKSKISGIRIMESDTEAFNGLVNAIGSVIKDPMELPEKDITTVDAILFVQQTLKESSDLYNKENMKPVGAITYAGAMNSLPNIQNSSVLHKATK